MLVCRGCCCGTERKHPGFDHDGQLATLRAAIASRPSARLWTVDCLGSCERSNVVVVRRRNERRWFGGLVDLDASRELAEWLRGGAGDPWPESVAARQFAPSVAGAAVARRLAWSTEEVVDAVEQALRERAGTWLLGVYGASAEVALDDGPSDVRRDGSCVTATSGSGALRLRVHASTAAFAVMPVDVPTIGVVALAVPRSHLRPQARRHVTLVGLDVDAVRDADRDSTLVDLGHGAAASRFYLRVPESELLSILPSVGRELDFGGRDGDAILRTPAHQVVTTTLGRAEIYAPIPAADGSRRPGSHSHLSGGELELGLDLPPGLVLPDGWSPAATFYPSPAWRARPSARFVG